MVFLFYPVFVPGLQPWVPTWSIPNATLIFANSQAENIHPWKQSAVKQSTDIDIFYGSTDVVMNGGKEVMMLETKE